jgi:hypothetical protein
MLSRYYKRAVLLPSALIISGYVLFAIIYVMFDLGRDYKSEWMTANNAVFYTLLIVSINALFVSILSTTIFLNAYKRVKENFLLTISSWFLLPCIWIGYLLVKHINYLQYSDKGLDSESLFVGSNTLPFLIGLALTFSNYIKNNRNH